MNNATEYRQWLSSKGMGDSQENRKAFRKVGADQREREYCTFMIAAMLRGGAQSNNPKLRKLYERLVRVSQ